MPQDNRPQTPPIKTDAPATFINSAAIVAAPDLMRIEMTDGLTGVPFARGAFMARTSDAIGIAVGILDVARRSGDAGRAMVQQALAQLSASGPVDEAPRQLSGTAPEGSTAGG